MTSARLPNAALGEVIRQARHLLISFDGPVCSEVAELPAAPAPYIHDVLAACHESGRFAAVISSSVPVDMVHAYLDAHDLAGGITIVARHTKADPASSEAELIRQAAQSLDASLSDCVMITSTPSAIEAARTVGVPTIGYARTPEEAEHLAVAGTRVAIYSMADLALRLREGASDRES